MEATGDTIGKALTSGPDGKPLPDTTFTPKHRWSIKLNFLSGITLLPWLHLLAAHWRDIHWTVYPHRILFLSLMALINTLLALPDWLLHASRVRSQPLHPEPVFILGHPRTGTTHLHNLLSCDPAFAYATTFHAGFPSSFLTLEPLRAALSGLLEPRRPMDNMALDWDLPAEDEIAVNVLTGGASPYMQLVLPLLWRRCWRRYLTFGRNGGGAEGLDGGAQAARAAGGRSGDGQGGQADGAARLGSGSGATAAAAAAGGEGSAAGPGPSGEGEGQQGGGEPLEVAFARWQRAFLWFMKKVTYRTARRQPPGCPPPPLLIKSPVHTGRVALWRDMFPAARYIYVHRHPLEVFQSAANMADTYYWYTYLQSPTDAATNDFICDQYELLVRSYAAERSRLPPGRVVEVAFAELDADPITVLRRIYDAFGWSERFEAVLPRFQRYVGSLADFKKNHFSRLSPQTVRVLRERWSDAFGLQGYSC